MERPLTGEPLAVDLVNTRWRTPAGDEDLLDSHEGLVQWLGEHDLSTPPTDDVRASLREARDALRRAFDHEPGADAGINAILARALIVRSLRDGRAHEHPFFPDDAWGPAWRAVDDYVRLRESGADSIRQCAAESCVLYFHDPSGRRRWCSMAGCGNRAKAHRHYARQQASAAGSEKG